jgi:hypothetical protein
MEKSPRRRRGTRGRWPPKNKKVYVPVQPSKLKLSTKIQNDHSTNWKSEFGQKFFRRKDLAPNSDSPSKMNNRSSFHVNMTEKPFLHISARPTLVGFFKYIFLWPMPLFILSTHKQCIWSHFIHNSTAMFP